METKEERPGSKHRRRKRKLLRSFSRLPSESGIQRSGPKRIRKPESSRRCHKRDSGSLSKVTTSDENPMQQRTKTSRSREIFFYIIPRNKTSQNEKKKQHNGILVGPNLF